MSNLELNIMEKIKPYFKDEYGELYHVEAKDLINYFKKNNIKFQLIFADPPYDINKADWDKFESREHYLDWNVNWIKQAGEILLENGSLFTMGFPEILSDVKYRISREVEWIEGIRWLTWHYLTRAKINGDGFSRSQESILWLTKSKEFKFYLDRIRVPYNKHTMKYPKRKQGQSSLFGNGDDFEWEPHINGARPRDVIDIPTVNNNSKENLDFDAQKPEALIRKFIWATTDKDDLVYDPFGGSGTTYAVCEQLGRKWRGSEIKKNHCDMIVKRLNNLEEKDNSLFWAKKDLESIKHRRKVRNG